MMTNIRNVAAIVAASAWLAACGGGSSPSEASIDVALSHPSVTVSGTPVGGAQVAFVNIAVTGSTNDLYVGAATTLHGVEVARISGTSLDNLQLELDFKESGILPDGVYDDTVRISVCRDQACAQPVAGSPFALPVSLTVSGSNATAVPTQAVRPTAFLSHDVVDAAMSKSLAAIVMASAQPSSAIWVYDIASGTEKSIALNKAPTSIALSPDGLKVAVGHDAMVSYIDLTDIATSTPAVREVPVATDVWDLVLDANNFVQAFPSADQWVDLYTLDMTAGTNEPTAAQLYEKTRARLHPDGIRMYVLDTETSPENIGRYTITAGMPAHTGQAPYWGDWAMCGNLWFSEAGDRIYTACGNTFTSDADVTQDMIYNGHIPLSDAGGYYPNIVWLDDSNAAGQAAYLDAGHCGDQGGADCDTLLRVTEHVYDSLVGAWWLPPVASGGAYRVQHGLFVFHTADNSLRMIGRLVGVDDATQAYYIDAPLGGGTSAAPQQVVPRRATSR